MVLRFRKINVCHQKKKKLSFHKDPFFVRQILISYRQENANSKNLMSFETMNIFYTFEKMGRILHDIFNKYRLFYMLFLFCVKNSDVPMRIHEMRIRRICKQMTFKTKLQY